MIQCDCEYASEFAQGYLFTVVRIRRSCEECSPCTVPFLWDEQGRAVHATLVSNATEFVAGDWVTGATHLAKHVVAGVESCRAHLASTRYFTQADTYSIHDLEVEMSKDGTL